MRVLDIRQYLVDSWRPVGPGTRSNRVPRTRLRRLLLLQGNLKYFLGLETKYFEFRIEV